MSKHTVTIEVVCDNLGVFQQNDWDVVSILIHKNFTYKEMITNSRDRYHILIEKDEDGRD